ncbi:MAG: SDR family NAD(P)-dependent oxidoreductase [Planctomycetota bacterium]|jgi:glucose 1-dehydrogenase
MIDLTGHTALVTGSTQGVGAAIAASLCRAGAKVILHGRDNDASAQSTLAHCRQLQMDTELVCFDLDHSIETVQQEFAARMLQQHPEIDLLVNNAGIFIDRPFLSMDCATFDRTFHLNVRVPYFLTQAFARYWVDRSIPGRVLFTGSINGLLAEPTHTAYDASKGAVAGLVRSLCVSLAPLGIRVNAIAPGLVRTPLTDEVLAKDPAILKWMEMHTPNQTVPVAEVCGPMAAFLLSDLAQHIHGQTIYIDGGMSAWQQPDLPDHFRAAMHAPS